ncbi:hypothetical protein HDU67_007186 [Dinochytrium kinnereticum]|nr:hypothetical protein HDU67_007186 [Dinochytrium kinnereticum]
MRSIRFWSSFCPMSIQIVQVSMHMLVDLLSTSHLPIGGMPFSSPTLKCLNMHGIATSTTALATPSSPQSPLVSAALPNAGSFTQSCHVKSFTQRPPGNPMPSRPPSPPLTPPSQPSVLLACEKPVLTGVDTTESLRKATFLCAHASRFPYPYRSSEIPSYSNGTIIASTVPTPSPHLLFQALFHAYRISRSATASEHAELLLKPHKLLLAGIIMAEAHLADIQTSTAVWAKLLGLEQRSQVADIKRMALMAVDYRTGISPEEYVSWLAHVRQFIQERHPATASSM